ncbi:MAG: hypothetical protein LBK58_15805 [Prevotellaceae bacterium]|jgi:tyrosine-protein phosphatase YwqE|nr:hypothetical protein [Prevotellaceae bacterium]
MTDIHSHFLYGVDDGMKTEEETFAALDCLEQQGVQGILSYSACHGKLSGKQPEILKTAFL